MVEASAIDGDSPEGTLVQGGVIPGTRKPAFTLLMREDLPIPVVLATPHSGRTYPAVVRSAMRDPEYSSIRLEDRFVDLVAQRVANDTGASLLVANAPRAMLDLNRSPEDVDWSMIHDANQPDTVRHSAANRRARSGLGLIPRRLSGLGEIWNKPLSHAELQARIRQIHTPYHTALAETLQMVRDRWGAALLVDVHSMPPLKRSRHDDVPAHFVLGDRFGASANDRIVASAIRYFADVGAGVAHNRPYAGGYVLDRHSARVQGIHAIQLEICRSRYLDADLTETTPELAGLARLVAGLVRELGEEVARLGRASRLPQAAE